MERLLLEHHGVFFFGPQSPYNSGGLLDSAHPQTSSRAEIEALSKALDIICNLVSTDFSLHHFYIRTDSSYVANTFSDWIQTWIKKKGKNRSGKSPAYFMTLMKIHERLEDMTYGADGGTVFRFWQIPREANKEADTLANGGDCAEGASVTRTRSDSRISQCMYLMPCSSRIALHRSARVLPRLQDSEFDLTAIRSVL